MRQWVFISSNNHEQPIGRAPEVPGRKQPMSVSVEQAPWRRKQTKRAEENDIEIDGEAWEDLLRTTSMMLLKQKEEEMDQAEALENYVVETLRDADNDEMYPWEDEDTVDEENL